MTINAKPSRKPYTATTTSRTGTSISFVVFIVFAVLKLLNVQPVAAWSWWWVTCPLWGGALLSFVVVFLVFFVVGFVRALR